MLSGSSFSKTQREREEVVEKLLLKSPELRPRNAAKKNAFQMKKYYKLFLVALTLLSLLCFLFYKTQYDKLYNVLQVLEFYESKDSSPSSSFESGPSLCPKSERFTEDFNRRSSDPLPEWKRLNDKLWIYSAFCPESYCPKATALVLATEDALNPKDLHCKLWHATSATGVEGIIFFQKLSSPTQNNSSSSSTLSSYLLYCENKYPSSIVPHGLTFYTKNGSVFTQIGGSDEETPPSSSISLCIAPQPTFMDSSYNMLENILWHQLFGVNNFYVYDGGSTKKFLTLLGSLGLRSTVTLLPWSLPKELSTSEERHRLLEMDCHMRSSKKFLTFTLLELQQILVPKSAKTLVEEFESLIPKDSKHLQIPLLRFCAEYPEKQNEDVVVTALGINLYYSPLTTSVSLVHSYGPHVGNSASKRPKPEDDTSKEISKNILSVNDYSACNNFSIDLKSPDTLKDDTIAIKFKTEFLKKYKHLFPHKDL